MPCNGKYCISQHHIFQLQDNPMGSVISLDPDRLNAKNEARLKKLKSIAGIVLQETFPQSAV